MASSLKYKKTRVTRKIKDVDRKAAIIKKSVAGIGQNMSRGAERVADIILNKDADLKGTKTKKITDETISMLKGVGQQFKSDLKGMRARDFVAVGAYNAGKASAAINKLLKNMLH